MRFRAPSRETTRPECFDHPVYAGFARHHDLLRGNAWPTLDELNARLSPGIHSVSRQPLRFVAQTPELLADGLHYEQRIFERGQIATRTGNWHDLLNALVWLERLHLKAAVNARYVEDIGEAGAGQRTRAQCALTLFDEGGVVVVLRDSALLEPALMASWDAHDWHGLFWRERDAWTSLPPGAEVIVFGHALLEHALVPHATLVAKAWVVRADETTAAIAAVAASIASGQAAADPQDLRPLPLCGIPGWHAEAEEESFYRTGPCFRPLRPGRKYPPLQREGSGL